VWLISRIFRPGKYTFRVIASNSDGVWNQTGASVRIMVVPPFWRTWWFLALLLALGAAQFWPGIVVVLHDWSKHAPRKRPFRAS